MSTLNERIQEIMDAQSWSASDVARVAGVSRSAVAQWLGQGSKMIKSIGRVDVADRLAKESGYSALWIAQGMGPKRIATESAIVPVPADESPVNDGYVRLEHLSPTPSMGTGTAVSEPVHVIQHLDVLESWVQQHVGTRNPARIKILTGIGNSMAPTIRDHDIVFVDVGQQHIDHAGIYVIDVAGRLLLKKVMILASGALILRSDNVSEYPDEERYDLKRDAETITICGKVLAWWTLKNG